MNTRVHINGSLHNSWFPHLTYTSCSCFSKHFLHERHGHSKLINLRHVMSWDRNQTHSYAVWFHNSMVHPQRPSLVWHETGHALFRNGSLCSCLAEKAGWALHPAPIHSAAEKAVALGKNNQRGFFQTLVALTLWKGFRETQGRFQLHLAPHPKLSSATYSLAPSALTTSKRVLTSQRIRIHALTIRIFWKW